MLKKMTIWVFFVCFGINLYAQSSSELLYGVNYYDSDPKTPGNNFSYSFRGENGDVMAVGDGSILYDITKNQVFSYLPDYSQGHTKKGHFVSPNYYFLWSSYDYSTSTFFSFNFSVGSKVINASNKPATSFDLFDSNHAIKIGNKEMVVYDLKTGDVVKTIGGPDPADTNKKFTEDFNDITTLPNGRGIIGGSSSSIYYTDDFSYFNKAQVNIQNDLTTVIFNDLTLQADWKIIGKINIAQGVPIFAVGNQFSSTGAGVVIRSMDDGTTWDSVFAVPNVTVRAVSAGSNTNAIIGGNTYSGGVLYYTKDGGDTWEKGDDAPNYIYSITHVSADSAYAVGAKGLILLTMDGGVNWKQISDDNPGFSGIYFSSPSVGYAASLTFNVLSVYKTTDAGENWNVAYVDSSFSPSNAFLNSVFFIDDMTGFIAGSKFIKTTDGGATWNEANTGVTSDAIFQDVYFVNNSHGFAVYRDPFTGDGAIKTTDGGTTWNPVNINNDKYDKRYIYFADENLGFVSGHSTLYRTTDGGDNWDTLAVGTNSQDLNSKVTFINSTTGFFGKKGQIFKTTDRGDTWTDAFIDNHSVPQQIQFASDSIGYTICTSDTFGIPVHVIFKTTNGGNNWSDLTDKLPGSTGFQYLFFTDEKTGYLAGSAGIIKTTTGGEKVVTSVRQAVNASVLSAYKLYQNFPNPFNPTTTIRFEVPEESKVELKVYDILGREVATLVNEVKHAGNYKVSFNASDFASGVYFFRLQAGSFTNTKKMILLR